MPKSKRRQRIVVNVNLPKSYGRQKNAAIGLIMANPLIALIIAAIGIALFILIGGISLPIMFGMMLNPLMWVAALVGAMIVLKSNGSSTALIAMAVLIGLMFWGYGVYQEYQSLQQVCSIPILGWIACTGWNVVTFVPKMFMLGLTISVSFVQVWAASFVAMKATGR